MGIENLPKAKWSTAGRQVILKADFIDIEDAILSQGGGSSIPPTLTWIDSTSVKISALTDSPANILMSGFPNILHPGSFIAGTSDRKYRTNTSDTVMDFDVPASLWGTEKVSQWHIIYGIAADEDTAFTLKAMPFLRVKSQADQVISLGNLITPATGIGYGFVTDELIDASIYIVSGASKGYLRTITANNNNNATGGTITYGDTALTLSQGDWIVVLPNTNFRWIGSIFNDDSGDLRQFLKIENEIFFLAEHSEQTFVQTDITYESIPFACPLAVQCLFTTVSGANSTTNVWFPGFSVTGVAIPLAANWGPIQNCKYRGYAPDGNYLASDGFKYPAGCGY